MQRTEQLLWLSDPHFDALGSPNAAQLMRQLAEKKMPVAISGDIADGSRSLAFLRELQQTGVKTIYFVLGNHDCYGTSIAVMKEAAHRLFLQQPGIVYLTKQEPIEIFQGVALIGHDGWADGKAADFLRSSIILRDYREIAELKALSPEELRDTLAELGEEAALQVKEKLLSSLARFDKVIFVTHAPPFREACLHEGKITDDQWAPHFVSLSVGDMITSIMKSFPEKECLILSGHTHAGADVRPLPNVRVLVSYSDYGSPAIIPIDVTMI